MVSFFMACLLGCGFVWLLVHPNIIHIHKEQVTYFLMTAIMSNQIIPCSVIDP